MQKVTLPAPAKLNLWLHIIGRRADGYHELETVFQFLDHGDELSFALRDDGVIRLHTEIEAVPHDSNLIVRAARMLQAQSGTTLGADIWLTKVLPMGGGIGGGSSDAATTLLGAAWAGLTVDDHNTALRKNIESTASAPRPIVSYDGRNGYMGLLLDF